MARHPNAKGRYLVVDDDQYEEFTNFEEALKEAKTGVAAGKDAWVPAERLRVVKVVATVSFRKPDPIVKILEENL